MEIRDLEELNPFYPNSFKDPLPSPTDLFSLSEEQLKKDLWGFSFLFPAIIQEFGTVKNLYNALLDLFDGIKDLKEKYRPWTESYPNLAIEKNINRGVSGSYFLVDEQGNRLYVLKPLDEDAGCVHSDGFATPFYDSPLRNNMPLYLSSMREVLAYQVSQMIGVDGIVPKTTLGIFTSDQFHDFAEQVHFDELKRYLDTVGFADKEKLCSVQEFVPNAVSLFEAMHEFQLAGLTDDEIAARFDQDDFENANLLLWTTYDTDGHQGNFLVYSKGTDAIGNEILGLKKIDNGLAFPDKNQQLRNTLAILPNANRELSEQAKAKIAAINIDELAHQFEQMGLESAVSALRQRMETLKEAAQKPGITIKEMNQILSKIGRKG